MVLLLWLMLISKSIGIETNTLVLKIENVNSTNGCLQIALFDSAASFLDDEKASYTKTVYHEKSGSLKVEIPNVAYGIYALAIFHDENNNGKLDKNIFGIPVEPYTFSNNPKIKWRGPQFEESKFEFDKENTGLLLQLRKWAKQ